MGFSSDGLNGGGTADVFWPDDYATTAAICGSVWPEYSRENAQIRAERHADLMRWLGAVVDKPSVRWWPAKRSDWRPPQVQRRPRMGLWSGHHDFRRGRHWDRTRH